MNNNKRGIPGTAVLAAVVLIFLSAVSYSQTVARLPSVAIVDFGTSSFSKLATERLRKNIESRKQLKLLDSELVSSAARGVGYSGSLNMSVGEARDLGAATASDFFVVGDAQTLRRSSSSVATYYESYCSLFIISSRTGQLVSWDRPSFEADTSQRAADQLLKYLASDQTSERFLSAIRKAVETESIQRAVIVDQNEAVIEEAPTDVAKADAQGLHLPRPYRRLKPDYPDTAARAEAEATVDVLVDVGADGEVNEVQLAKWAGFGLDEITVATVRQLHFFPATRNGTPVPMRVLLRYNFRKPQK